MLIDKDVLEPGNLERHACTMQHVGASKSEAVAHLLRQAAPYTEVVAWQLPAGRVETSALADQIAASDLVIDATAEVGVARLTAHLAREHDTPWVMAAGTNGAWGGTVVRIDSGSTWCFSCFEWHRADDIASGGSSLAPIADVAPPNQPVGCAEPTFTGTGFDLDEVGMQAVRSAVGVLLQCPTIDVATLAIHGFDEPDLPRWNPHRMQPHAECAHQ